ncbi:putative baseplate assembly protein [Streptomyces radiopugnans]|uniref:putative baseplate assembly protein n=1 Tax=Streptomyces radiopugnans TaxID=403935 RepID=UPI003F1E0B17
MSGGTGTTVPRRGDRRGRVRAARLNGVDAVEVGDDGLTLAVTFLGKAPHGLCPENIRIDGGRGTTDIRAVAVEVEREEDPELDDLLYVTVDRTGGFGRHRLAIVETDPYGRPGTEPFPGFDQRYHAAEFSFRPGCPSPLDCAEAEEEGEAAEVPGTFRPAPVIDYTARDYDTLRRLVMERLALTAPDWTERNPADLGTTLVELLAYTADQISHQQDAVATEAYLDTARRRVSVRRHVRLVDYPMHDGCSARALVAVEVARPLTLLAGTYRFAAVDVRTLGPRDRPRTGTVIDDRDLAVLEERGSVEVFEPVGEAPLRLRPEHNTIRLWTWGGEQCALPKGATSATLRDEWAGERPGEVAGDRGGEGTGEGRRERRLGLRPGDLLVLEEVRGPRSGTPGDADPTRRQAVRLTSVTPAVDRLCDQPVLEVAWAREDALAFPLHLTALGGRDCEPVEDVTVARANVVLVDHGRSLTFRGHLPERLEVPPVPAVVPSCGPPAFGCRTGAYETEGNRPGRLILDRLRQTACGRLLTPAHIRELSEVVGEEAVRRAGLGVERAGRRGEKAVPGTAYEQEAALETLLAQSVYPGIVPRLRPRLHRFPVAQTAPFPDPRHVSAGQAERLAAIPGRMQRRLVELWRGARDRDGLNEREITELAVLFGLKTLERLELRRRPVPALRELLHRSERLLAAKLRRLEVLTARARAGRVLDGRTAWEIAHSWGPAYAAGLHPDEPELHGPASALVPEPRAALPAVRLTGGTGSGDGGDGEGAVWEPRRDLLGSGPRDRHFVGELEDDGRLALRFGDGLHGARPEPGTTLEVHYRLGGGRAGNVGAEAINHLVLCREDGEAGRTGEVGQGSDAGEPMPVAGVRNPLPAAGGTEPEPVEQVRRFAPAALGRVRLRAVTAEDYAELASALPGVQRAAAEIRWTGSVREAHVAVDADGTGQAPAELLDAVAQSLEAYRLIGHDLVVGPARPVPLDLEVEVCVVPGHQTGRILADLRRVLGNRRLPGGRLGLFHPDALGFGEPVRLSRLVAVAAAVPGVESVRVTRLRRLFADASTDAPDPTDHSALEDGVLRLAPLEIARCDNDPERPENGRLALRLGGAR